MQCWVCYINFIESALHRKYIWKPSGKTQAAKSDSISLMRVSVILHISITRMVAHEDKKLFIKAACQKLAFARLVPSASFLYALFRCNVAFNKREPTTIHKSACELCSRLILFSMCALRALSHTHSHRHRARRTLLHCWCNISAFAFIRADK
jgi:hypothetical protein